MCQSNRATSSLLNENKEATEWKTVDIGGSACDGTETMCLKIECKDGRTKRLQP